MGTDASSATPINMSKASAVLASACTPAAQELAFINELDAAGASFHAHCHYAEAETCYRIALSARTAHAITDLTYLNTLHRLRVLYRLQRIFAEAEKIHLQAIAFVKATFGTNHPRVADQNNYLAGIYYASDRAEDAARVTLESLVLYETLFGSESLPVGLCHFALALIYHKTQNANQSQKHFTAAQDIVAQQVYTQNETIEEGLLGIAILHFLQNDVPGAETLFRQSIILREDSLWPFHPLVPETLLKLGHLYEGRGMHAKAALCYETALSKQQNAFGPEHPMLVDTLIKLAHFHSRCGDAEKAKQFGLQLLNLQQI